METKMIDMARYSMTEEISGCPMGYGHGIESDNNIMEELEDAVGLVTNDTARGFTLERNNEVKCMMEKIGKYTN